MRAGGSAGEMRGAWKPPGSAACVALAWGVWLVRVEPKGRGGAKQQRPGSGGSGGCGAGRGQQAAGELALD